MTKTIIYLDNDESVFTEMTYSDVLNALTKSTGFVEFINVCGEKEAVSPAHVAEVRQFLG